MKKNKIKNIKKYKNGAEINFQDVNNGFQNPVFYQDPNRFKTIVPEPEARNFFMESLADLGKGALSIGSVVANVIPGYGQAISAGLSAINSAVGPTRSQQVAKKKGKGDFLTSLDDVGSKVSAGLQNMQGSKEGTSGNGIIGDVTKITDPEVQTQGDSWFKLPKNQYEAPKIKNGGMIQKYNNGAMVPIQADGGDITPPWYEYSKFPGRIQDSTRREDQIFGFYSNLRDQGRSAQEAQNAIKEMNKHYGNEYRQFPINSYHGFDYKDLGNLEQHEMNYKKLLKQANGGMVPIQAEQDENFILPNGEIMQSNADSMHEQMGANEITDILPQDSYGTSVRNKMSLKELSPYLDEKTLPMFQEIYKKLGKKSISPNDISEMGRKTQKEATPNSFKTEELNKSSKDIYSQLAMHMNEIINVGKQVQQQMKNGGMVKKYTIGGYIDPMEPEGSVLQGFKTNRVLDMNEPPSYWGARGQKAALIQDNYYKINHPKFYKKYTDRATVGQMTNAVGPYRMGIDDEFRKENPNLDLQGYMLSSENNDMDNWIPPTRKQIPLLGADMKMLEGNTGSTLGDFNSTKIGQDFKANDNTGGRKKRFKFGNDEILLGVQGLSNLYAKNSAMKQTPNHWMETPSTYISSMKTEMPIGSDLYNIEKSGKNTNQFLRDNTNSYSLLAGNAANNNATTTNKIGDYLTNINQQNVGLYNKQQELLQGLLGDNMKIQNQNATDQNDMANYKRMLDSEMWKQNVDKFGKYVENKNVKNQQQDNTEMSFIHLIGANPDLAKNPAVAEFLKNFLSKNKTILNK